METNGRQSVAIVLLVIGLALAIIGFMVEDPDSIRMILALEVARDLGTLLIAVAAVGWLWVSGPGAKYSAKS